MEKEQPDSLATVAVGSEKIPPTHSHYAPSEVYSTTEPPPAYMRPVVKSTAVQIARIAALTLITMSVVLGSFILAASWVQSRASCTPESITAMKADLRVQQQQQQESMNYRRHPEFLGYLKPESLVQDSISDSSILKKDTESDAKNIKIDTENNNMKDDNENGDRDENDEDYEDDEYPPVHIKLPLQLDLDDIANTLMQQARSRVSCVVERRRADQVMDGNANNNINNSSDPQRFQRLSGERVSILCESGNPDREQQDPETMTPIIVPLGSVQIPLQSHEPNLNYNQYQIHNQYQVPDMQQLPLSDSQGLNHIPSGVSSSESRNTPHRNMEMKSTRVGPTLPMDQHYEMRQVPIEVHQFQVESLRSMRPPISQESQSWPMMFQQVEQVPAGYVQDQQSAAMIPPSLPPQRDSQVPEHRSGPLILPAPQTEQRPQAASVDQERSQSPFQRIPFEIKRIIQHMPTDIKNIIQQITGDSPIPEGARREDVDDFKLFPAKSRPVPIIGPFPLSIEIKNLMEHGNIEGRQQSDETSEQRQDAKPFPGPEDQGEEVERNFPIPPEVRRIIHQFVEGRVFPLPRFSLPLRPIDSIEIPVEARAEISDEQSSTQSVQNQQHQERSQEQLSQTAHMIVQEQVEPQQQEQSQEQNEKNRPHYVQPRSVRSVPDAFTTHHREKRMRRCACDCAC